MSFEFAERKLAAIMAVDMVGFSRLLGQDEPGTLRRLAKARAEVIDPAVHTHHGRVFKATGDGALAEFPSAVLGLRCAIEIQTRLHELDGEDNAPAPLRFRIAVHQGEVVIDGDDLLGDGVNVAARLERLAEPGGICISARVQEDATGKIPLRLVDLGPHRLRNITRSVNVFRVALPWQEHDDPESERTFVRMAPSRHYLLIPAEGRAIREIPIGPEPLTIGRTPPCPVVLRDREVSRQHCQLELRNDEVWLTDLDSSNGTFLDGNRLSGPALLANGAVIRLGNQELIYHNGGATPLSSAPQVIGAPDPPP